ncbi:MAG: S-methyl-5'-thioadenosine phosphorylase [Nanoarchaeota archaeon]
MVKIGIIGGSGIASLDFLESPKRIKKHTPYGPTSDLVTIGKLSGVDVVVIPRHGDNHHIMPSLVNFRANIWTMKDLGVTHILATSACGSLREEIKPGHLVFPDQFIDRTTKRIQTFYEGLEFCHIAMSDPFCQNLRKILGESADRLKIASHKAGTVITIEGPRFSTKAESKIFRQWNADIINMSTVPEVVLAREAEICYAVIALSTDYDCWHESEKAVSWEMIVARMKEFSGNFKRLVLEAIPKITAADCSCRHALKGALV